WVGDLKEAFIEVWRAKKRHPTRYQLIQNAWCSNRLPNTIGLKLRDFIPDEDWEAANIVDGGISFDADLRSTAKLLIGQKELFAAHLSTKAQDDRLLKWIVDDQVRWTSPFVVEVPSFRSFVSGINPKYAIPSRKTITRRIVSTYYSRLNDMKSRLYALDCKVSLTYDVWTSKANLPYASVTAHCVDSDWKLQDRLYSFTYFPYPHTAQRHQDLIMDTIQSFGLEARIFSCVSDDEEATVQGLRAVKVVLERDYKNSAFQPLRCAVHTMQLPLKKVFQECSKVETVDIISRFSRP
ncbi:hypothetical protein V1521DRAFT_448739, partial [Lipomyces starkeyi]